MRWFGGLNYRLLAVVAAVVSACGCSSLPMTCPTQAMTDAYHDMEREYEKALDDCIDKADTEFHGMGCMLEVEEKYERAFELHEEQRKSMQRCQGVQR